MVKYCAMLGCTNSTKGTGRSFHKFPKDDELKALWIDATGMKKRIPNWRPNYKTLICSAHFHGFTPVISKLIRNELPSSEAQFLQVPIY